MLDIELHFMASGNFNMKPTVAKSTNCMRATKSQLILPQDRPATCMTGSTIDYGIASIPLAPSLHHGKHIAVCILRFAERHEVPEHPSGKIHVNIARRLPIFNEYL